MDADENEGELRFVLLLDAAEEDGCEGRREFILAQSTMALIVFDPR
jgi:hypothetical protein